MAVRLVQAAPSAPHARKVIFFQGVLVYKTVLSQNMEIQVLGSVKTVPRTVMCVQMEISAQHVLQVTSYTKENATCLARASLIPQAQIV